jgi:hypothetical protein
MGAPFYANGKTFAEDEGVFAKRGVGQGKVVGGYAGLEDYGRQQRATDRASGPLRRAP